MFPFRKIERKIQERIFRIDEQVLKLSLKNMHTFLLFLPTFIHLFTVLSQKRTSFCLPDESSFFRLYSTFSGKTRQNQESLGATAVKGTVAALFLCPQQRQNGLYFFVVLCSNKEQHKQLRREEFEPKIMQHLQNKDKIAPVSPLQNTRFMLYLCCIAINKVE